MKYAAMAGEAEIVGRLLPPEAWRMILKRYEVIATYAAGRRLLDVCCGAGLGLGYLARAGVREVWGVDLSPENVAQEIEEVVSQYGAREIAFLDDSFVVEPERVLRLCEAIQARKLDITWSVPVGLTVWKVDEPILRAMRDCGFYRACFPVESGDPAMLEYIRKPVDLDKVRETIQICHRLGIWTYGNFLIGFPEQTPESVEMTAHFAETCGFDMINVYIVQPFRGAELWNIMERMGLLNTAEAAGSTILHTVYDTKYFTAAELRAKRAEIYARFTRRRVRRLFTPAGLVGLLRKMNSPERFAYALRVFATFAKNSLISRRFTIVPE